MKELGSKFKQKYKSLKSKVQPVGFCLDQVKEIARQQNINGPVNGLVGRSNNACTGYIAFCQKLCSVLIMTIGHSSYYPLSKASWLQHENLCNSLSIIQWEQLIHNSSFTPSHHCILCHFHPASKSSARLADPVSMSYIRVPRLHQSTARLWPLRINISGALEFRADKEISA